MLGRVQVFSAGMFSFPHFVYVEDAIPLRSRVYLLLLIQDFRWMSLLWLLPGGLASFSDV